MGISNTFAQISGIVAPTLAGYIVVNSVSFPEIVFKIHSFLNINFLSLQSTNEWQIIFMITSGVYLLGSVIYWIWASGEIQPWAKDKLAKKFSHGLKNYR